MKKVTKTNFSVIATLLIISLSLLISACDDSFNEKIETGRELKKQKEEVKRKAFRPGNKGVIAVKDVGENNVRIRWKKAIFKERKPVETEYSIYVSYENNINTVRKAFINGTLIHKQANINRYNADILSSNTYYYINIIAKYGNRETIYNTISIKNKTCIWRC
jgi:hypothetical protein